MRDDLCLMFSVIFFFLEITKVVYWFEYIGMVLTATQDDSVLFGTNSGVVLNALSQYIKTF